MSQNVIKVLTKRVECATMGAESGKLQKTNQARTRTIQA